MFMPLSLALILDISSVSSQYLLVEGGGQTEEWKQEV
jgi:hypothetical protein